jgi:acetyl esterase
MRDRKPIDSALRCFLDEQAVASDDSLMLTCADRTHFARGLMVKALESRESIPGLPNNVKTRELNMARGLSGRVYLPPAAARALPVLVYLHGGGWVIGSVATHDPFCRLLSEAAGVIVISVEYRLAPEHPYPAAVDDTLAAVQWAVTHSWEWGGDPTRLALGGDSAGANLAAVAANRLCETVEAPGLRALMLLYPVTDHPSANHPSYTENAVGYGLDANTGAWLWEQYAPCASPNDPGTSPARLERVPALPATLVATAEYDVLRDDGIAYAEKLKRAGVAVTHIHAADMHHNFPVHPETVARFPQCQAALNEIAGWLQATLAVTDT